jgi:glycosyltransferase involved in cell wall biosynthesis
MQRSNERGRSRLRLSLCLVTWNEVDGCRHDLPRLPLDEFEEVYAVDAGSTDGTIEFLASRGITVHKQSIQGYNQAYICAFEKCKTDVLVLFHPKGNIDPVVLRKFPPLFEEGYDLVIASRMIKGSMNEEDDRLLRPRKWFVLGLSLLCATIWHRAGNQVWDVLHGLRGMRRDRFHAIKPLPSGLSIDLEMVVRSYRHSFRIAEFPVIEESRRFGKTHFKAFPTGRRLLGYIAKEFWRAL